jgi:hypothetical protein
MTIEDLRVIHKQSVEAGGTKMDFNRWLGHTACAAIDALRSYLDLPHVHNICTSGQPDEARKEWIGQRCEWWNFTAWPVVESLAVPQ